MKNSKMLLKTILAATLALAMIVATTGCGAPEIKFPNTPQGFEFQLSEAVLDIDQSITFAESNKGYIDSVTLNATVTGFEELSYFDGIVYFTWTYEYLSDSGEYIEDKLIAEVELDASGTGSYSETIALSSCRAYRNVQLNIEFDGYAIRI